MTRWDILGNLMLSYETRKAVGTAWPLFLYVIFRTNKANKLVTSYDDLKRTLEESPNTIKWWRDVLEKTKILRVVRGRMAMTLTLLPPYDSLATCEQDDITQIKIKSDPSTRSLIDKLSSYGNMSLLPVVAELAAKLDKMEKKLSNS